jgi:hypothetical protein
VVSVVHEGAVLLLRRRPALVLELLAQVPLVSVPRFRKLRVGDSSFQKLSQHRADLVVDVLDRSGAHVLGVVVEVQRRRRAAKKFVWPLYAAAQHARLRCPVVLLVIATSAATARWAARPIASCHGFTPVVVGPDGIPWIADEAKARASPELAVLSALMHGNRPGGLDVAVAAVTAAARLDDERARFYHELILAALNEAARRALEKMMDLKGYPWSDFARKHMAEGRAKGKAEALLAIFAARRMRVTTKQRTQILACHDARLLARWIRHAVSAERVRDVLV